MGGRGFAKKKKDLYPLQVMIFLQMVLFIVTSSPKTTHAKLKTLKIILRGYI